MAGFKLSVHFHLPPRMGTLTPGDVILAINGRSLEQCNLREAAHILRNAGDIVTLTISKECSEKPTTGCECIERAPLIMSVTLKCMHAPRFEFAIMSFLSLQ